MQYLNQLASTRRPWLLLAFTAFCLEITALYFQHVMPIDSGYELLGSPILVDTRTLAVRSQGVSKELPWLSRTLTTS